MIITYDLFQSGGNSSDIISFLKNEKIEVINKNLLKYLSNNKYCDKVVGEGYMGKVYRPGIPHTIDGKEVVVKKSKKEGEFHMKIINKELFIWCYQNSTIECVILEYITKLKSYHLPKLLGYSTCSSQYVDTLVLEKYGMEEKEIKVVKKYFDDQRIFFPGPLEKSLVIYKSQFITLLDLLDYIVFFREGMNIKLPNGNKCGIIDLLDSFYLAYLYTYQQLVDEGIIPIDMHYANIFLEWSDTPKEFEYSYKGNKYRSKNYGVIIKLGDVGSFLFHPRKDVYLLGQGFEIDKQVELLKETVSNPNYKVLLFLDQIKLFPIEIAEKTIAGKIMRTHPYNCTIPFVIDLEYKKDYLSAREMLTKYFKKYLV